MSLSFFWLAVGAGLLAIVTPCVFPLIPLTATYFSDRQKSRADAMRSGLFFALGIIFTFSIIGLVVAATIGASGLSRFASSPSVNIAFAILFLVFAMLLHGSRTFSLPSRFVTWFTEFANRYDRRSVIGPILLGGLFALTSFTCTTPFVGTLLVLAARDQWLTPLAGMLVFSTVFALPFFALATAPGLSQALPKSGPWLEKTKRIVGLFELAAAAKFASNADMVMGWNVFTRQFVIFVWAMAVLFALWILVQNRFGQSRLRAALGFAPLVLGGWFAFSRSEANFGSLEAFLPPPALRAEKVQTTSVDAGWIMNDYNAALAQARSSGKLVFVDFTGYTCTNCRWMEANIFAKPEVKKVLDGFVLSRLYTDGEGEMYEKQQAFQEEKFSTVALPLYAIVDGQGNTLATFAGLTRDTQEFLTFLRKASPRS